MLDKWTLIYPVYVFLLSQVHLLLLAWQWLRAVPFPVGGFLQHLHHPTLLGWLLLWPPSHLSPPHSALAASAPVLCLPIPCWAWCNQEWAWCQWVWEWGLQEWAWAWCSPAPWACRTAGSPQWHPQAQVWWDPESHHLLSWFWVGPQDQEGWWVLEDQWEVEERRAQAPTHFFFEEVSPLLGSPFSLLCHTCCPLQSPPPSPMQFVSKKKNVYISIFKENKQTKKKRNQKNVSSFPFLKALFHFRIIISFI